MAERVNAPSAESTDFSSWEEGGGRREEGGGRREGGVLSDYLSM